MQSIDLVRDNLSKSRDHVLRRIDDMRAFAMVPPTPNGGCHTLWLLGHLAYIEALIIHTIMREEPNPVAEWEADFDDADVSADPTLFPPFDSVLATCRERRTSTLVLIDSLTEADLDRTSASVPTGYENVFGTHRLCLQYAADHWYMHRGQFADCRRAAGLERMWV